MSITISHRIIAVAAVAAIAVGALALAAQLGAGTAAGHRANAAAQAATVRYWTSARIAAALRAAGGQAGEPARPERSLVRRLVRRLGDTTGDGLRWTHNGAAADAVGKIFFTLDDEDYVCSGTLVGGRQPDVVLTAAHCVSGGRGRGGGADWATNWMFVPGFRDGQMPYGEYTARQFFVMPGWTGPTGSSEQYDVAFVRVDTGTLYGGSGAASPPPGLPVAFTGSQDAAPASRAYVFGYPSLPPYTGMYLDYCAGPVTASGGSMRMPCAMTAGDSGGPWLAGFSPLSGNGTVVAVSTYKISDDMRVLYGAVLGPQARALYARAVSLAR